MNRFRQLKDKLINSKRDSQKLEPLPSTETEIQDWVKQELEYYGISRESYRLKQLKNIFHTKQPQPSNKKIQSNRQTADLDLIEANTQRRHSCKNTQSQNEAINVSFGQNEHKQKESQQVQTPRPAKRIICKKSRNTHTNSMNDAEQILTKQKQQLTQQSNIFRSFQAQNQQATQKKSSKQLDYYTLILQLTAELNYSRLNKQTSNEKSILNQIKNLISFIEGKSANETGAQSGQANSGTDSHNSNTYKKSYHTFSSIYSNESLGNQNENSSAISKRRIKYKLIEPTSQEARSYEQKYSIEQQNNQSEDEQNETFKSVNAFEEQNQSEDSEEDKKSIIDLVNNDSDPRDDILIQDSDDCQNLRVQNSPLSRITERESEYTSSGNASPNSSPSKQPENKALKPVQKLQFEQKFDPEAMQKHIETLYTKNIFKKSSDSFKQSQKEVDLLPQNQMILKKLSDKLEKTDELQNLLENSLEYKRILYMLDSEYAGSDFKNRTFSSLLTHTQNHNPSDKSTSLFYAKNSSESSAKSFAKQIFESNQESTHKQNHHYHKSACLLSKLDSLFRSQFKLEDNLPKLLKFESENESDGRLNQQKFKKHQRSHTSCELSSKEEFSRTKKYRFNVSQQLCQQINAESSENAFDRNKYEPMKTEYDQDSVYQKVSRNSYLTSSSSQSQAATSSESQLEPNPKKTRKGNLIVKKKDKTIKLSNFQEGNTTQKQNKFKSQLQLFVKKASSPSKYTHSNKQNIICVRNQKQLAEIEVSVQKVQPEEQSLHSIDCMSSNRCQSSMLKNSNHSMKSPSLNDSKTSLISNRQIKYKVYSRPNQLLGTGQKEDKRKVLKDIISILNSKYNKNIQLKE